MQLREIFLRAGYPPTTLKDPPAVVLNLGLAPERVQADLLVTDGKRPLLIADYAPGAVRSRTRGLVAYARLAFPEGPPPLVLQTNGRDFVLVETEKGREIAYGGPEVIPSYEALLSRSSPAPVDSRRRKIEEKILFIHSTGG